MQQPWLDSLVLAILTLCKKEGIRLQHLLTKAERTEVIEMLKTNLNALATAKQLGVNHKTGSACVQDVHRGCALLENDSGCAPTARLSAESSDIYSRSTPPSNFEIGSSH
jgi:hypothetical protein